jgi:hypothetical protein
MIIILLTIRVGMTVHNDKFLSEVTFSIDDFFPLAYGWTWYARNQSFVAVTGRYTCEKPWV